VKHNFIFILITSMLIASCSQGTSPQEPAPVLAEPGPDKTVIFSERDASAQLLEVNLFRDEFNGYWTPSVEQVLVMESGLADYLGENGLPETGFENPVPVEQSLPDYYRQYFGYIAPDESRIIYGNFSCTEIDDWDEQWLYVDDGGNCFFQVQYNLDTGTYFGLIINGEA